MQATGTRRLAGRVEKKRDLMTFGAVVDLETARQKFEQRLDITALKNLLLGVNFNDGQGSSVLWVVKHGLLQTGEYPLGDKLVVPKTRKEKSVDHVGSTVHRYGSGAVEVHRSLQFQNWFITENVTLSVSKENGIAKVFQVVVAFRVEPLEAHILEGSAKPGWNKRRLPFHWKGDRFVKIDPRIGGGTVAHEIILQARKLVFRVDQYQKVIGRLGSEVKKNRRNGIALSKTPPLVNRCRQETVHVDDYLCIEEKTTDAVSESCEEAETVKNRAGIFFVHVVVGLSAINSNANSGMLALGSVFHEDTESQAMVTNKAVGHEISLKLIDDRGGSFNDPPVENPSKDFAVRIDEGDWAPVC
ncbi:hypothetical protein [Parasitella parasitica]|uniref:Uncharacterized protein n=1 Tax=Parasitella parasitica TaxID=35722 RepID=A0A0B7NEX3_9FUNG|nr:hypothetical protein [Parasitella parasitica]